MRRIQFKIIEEIAKNEKTIRDYLAAAIKIHKSGEKIEFKKSPEAIPEELETKFSAMPKFRKAFEALTPGRQRGYILYISAAKQSKTRMTRIEKHIERILRGEDLHDR